jgi:acyl-coenzyme A synthetase/AMP-(fatty) acid ligase/3-hydroxymyristoyl/3-hydroxydecanoyl-(acyl carrier protein) dehydratase
MSAMLPLLGTRDLHAPLAWQAGQPISAARFLTEAQALALQLPAHGPAVNLCQDRYRFALGLAAALLRGHTSLMPPNALPETLRGLQVDGTAPYALVDDDIDVAGLQRLRVERPDVQAVATDGSTAMPALNGDQVAIPVLNGDQVAIPVLNGDQVAIPVLNGDQVAVCLLTSGSTGAPQPHQKAWQPLVHNIAAEAERLAVLLGLPDLAGLTIVATVPPQHSYGFESSVLLAMLGGAAFDSGRPFYPADIVAALERVPRPRALVTTPFHLKTLLRAGLPLPPVDLVLSATAPLSPQLAAEAEAALSGRLIEIYGCTEAGQVAARRTTDGEVWTALGALHLWREADASGGERFLVEGGHVTTPTPLADILDLLDARRFRLLGRANDLIHVAGKRSSLAHLNFHLNRIDGVQDGAYWLPDDVADGVVRPVAFVVAPGLTARQVIQGLRDRLEAAFVPRRVVLLDELPREGTGKITAATLRALAARHLPADDAGAGEDTAATAPTTADAPRSSAVVRTSAGSGPDATFPIPADHPAFDGHFPGQPILPGVALLNLVLQALDRQPTLRQGLGPTPGIDTVKFTGPVMPGTRLRVALSEQGRGVGFDVWDGTRCVAKGRLVPTVPAVPAAAGAPDA